MTRRLVTCSGRYSPASLLFCVVILALRVTIADDDSADSAPATLTCTGLVQDALFGKPLAGAKVTIWKLAAPETVGQQGGKALGRFEAVTNAEGKYTFQLPTDHSYLSTTRAGGNRFIPLEIEASASGYAAGRKAAKVYLPTAAMQAIASRTELAEGFNFPTEKRSIPPQSYWTTVDTLELRPGKEVTGVVQSADGKPVVGAKIVAHSQVPMNERKLENRASGDPPDYSNSSREVQISDSAGRFRIAMITPGEGLLMIYPVDQQNAPLVKTLYDQRGDLGVIKLPRGRAIQGRVLDEAGKPLAGVFVGADGAYQTPTYSDYHINQQLRRAAETDADGNFVIGALPAGEYRIEPKDQLTEPVKNPHESPERRPPGIFPPQKVTIAEGQPPPKIEFRAVPLVVVSGRFIVDSPQPAGNFGGGAAPPFRFRPQYLQGKFMDLDYRQTLNIEDDGNFKLTVPKGLSDATIQLFASGSGQPVWRLRGEEQSHNDKTIDLGKLNDEVTEIEIEYASPLRGGRRGGPGGAAAPAAARGGRAAAANPPQAARGGRGGRGAANPGMAAQQANESDAAKKEEEIPKEVTGTGTVIDADTGQPISGAKVRVWQYEPNVKNGGYKYIRHVDTVTDIDGKYRFTFATDHVETLGNGATIIRVEPEVTHAEYVAPSQLPRPFDLITLHGLPLPGLSNARRASFESRELQPIEVIPAKEATGVLQSPEGKPVAGVRVFANPTAPIGQLARVRLQSGLTAATEQGLTVNRQTLENQPYGVDDTVTDAEGRFRFLLPTSGECKLSIWPAKEFAPVEFQIHDKRGDLGAFTLNRGRLLRGQVSDVDGKPLEGIYLAADRIDASGKPAAEHVSRATITDASGIFEFAPLPPGDYRIEPRDAAGDLTTEQRREPPPERHPLPGFFAPLKVTLTENQEPKPIKIRTTPTVEISGQATFPSNLLGAFTDVNPSTIEPAITTVRGTRNEPLAEHDDATGKVAAIRQLTPSVRGKLNGFAFEAKGDMDDTGHFAIKVPKGLNEAVIVLRTAFSSGANRNQGGSGSLLSGAVNTIEPQWRAEKSKPLVTGMQIPLGDVGSEVTGIEIVYSEEQAAAARGRTTSPASRRSSAANAPPSE